MSETIFALGTRLKSCCAEGGCISSQTMLKSNMAYRARSMMTSAELKEKAMSDRYIGRAHDKAAAFAEWYATFIAVGLDLGFSVGEMEHAFTPTKLREVAKVIQRTGESDE